MADRYRLKPLEVQALQVLVGRTRRREILELCPGANVGVSVSYSPGIDKDDSTDLRWVVLPGGVGSADGHVCDTEWIVRLPDGSLRIVADEDFADYYEVVT